MTIVRRETITPVPAQSYRSTFADGEPSRAVGDELPPAWEGMYFPYDAALADLRPDGSPARDGVTPEVDLPRRLYAGESTRFLRPIRLGDEATQTVSLGSVVEKNGSSGRLMFVDVEREYAVGGEVAVHSVWHDVFLEQADPDAPVRAPRKDPDAAAKADWAEELTPDIRQLFRFSAITFNTHLVHYDRAWAREVEGLDDVLVHGPLTRILLMDASRRHVPGRRATALEVRSIAPVLVDRPLRIVGRTDGDVTRVTALDAEDVVLATADVSWS